MEDAPSQDPNLPAANPAPVTTGAPVVQAPKPKGKGALFAWLVPVLVVLAGGGTVLGLWLAGVFNAPGNTPPASSPAVMDDARAVVERFSSAMETHNCADLFATLSKSARTSLGITWNTVEECVADRSEEPDGSETMAITEVNETDETHATATLNYLLNKEVAGVFALELSRSTTKDPWIITKVDFTFSDYPGPSPSPSAQRDDRREFLFLAQDFITALANRDCFFFKIATTEEFQKTFAANAGASDICDVVENGNTAPWEEVTVKTYSTIDEGSPDKLWGDMTVIYTFKYEGELWDQELKFGYWHQEGAPGALGVWKVNSFESKGAPTKRG